MPLLVDVVIEGDEGLCGVAVGNVAVSDGVGKSGRVGDGCADGEEVERSVVHLVVRVGPEGDGVGGSPGGVEFEVIERGASVGCDSGRGAVVVEESFEVEEEPVDGFAFVGQSAFGLEALAPAEFEDAGRVHALDDGRSGLGDVVGDEIAAGDGDVCGRGADVEGVDVADAVDVPEVALDLRVDAPGLCGGAGAGAPGVAVLASGAIEVFLEVGRASLDEGDDAGGPDADGPVQLLDRVAQQFAVGASLRLLDEGVAFARAVASVGDLAVLEVGEVVVQKASSDHVVSDLGEELGAGVEIVESPGGEDGEGLVVLLLFEV